MSENQQLQTTASPAPAGGLAERAKAMAGGLTAKLREASPRQRLWAGLSAGVFVLLVAGILWFASRTDWRTLYAGLEPADARAMGAQLTAAGIPFDVSPDGATLRVPAQWLDKARLQTASTGGPHSGRMGFEIFDKPNWIGSEFDEKVNYQRALEGELEHTISTMEPVETARVHLVMPHDSLFTDQQRQAKASVVLKLKHRDLTREEADSIRNLVANAVDDLHPDDVSLVDAAGRAQLGRKTPGTEAAAHEQELAAKLIETLEPVAGVGNVRASVNVDYDSSSADEVDEIYDPTQVVTLSMQRAEETGAAKPAVSGVPGTASNAPNTQPPLFPQQASSDSGTRQENGSYAASKRTRHTIQAAGKVRRITAAILVNDRLLARGSGNRPASWQTRSPEELRHLTDLAQAAIGYDSARGDQVSVQDIAFEDNSGAVEPGLAERMWSRAGDLQTIFKYAAILAAFLALIFFVLRPLVRRAPAVPLAEPAEQAALAEGAPVEMPVLEQPDLAVERQKQRAQMLFDQVTEHVRQEPAQSARLLQGWIHAE